MKMMLNAAAALVCMLVLHACSQNQQDAAAPARPEKIDPNPSPDYLSAAQSMKTMHLPAGYHLELVAGEPDIEEPVAVVWDANGRMFVAEMRSYMQDIKGTGERLPICRITMLEDTNGDGRMDKHTVFIDSLVLPRMMLPLGDRLVVSETYSNNLYSYRDTNGDGKADEKRLVYHNDSPDDANLEHQKSGLVWNIDNWIYVTKNPVRYRYSQGNLVADTLETTPDGQWGLTFNNYGRLFFSSAGGEVAALNFQENPQYGELDFDNQLAGNFNEVWPVTATPDVQGGQERLRPDSTLNHFTASCGQSVFRGDRLPQALQDNLFICEPVGRLIRRAILVDSNGESILKNAYENREFLASTDMNFRPVNTATGPDGCLYIVDMYHGIIQESAWTQPDSYIYPQIKRKGLDTHTGRGRIYRVVHDGFRPGPRPQLLKAASSQLVDYLSHPNGWWRDNAQRLLVLRGDQSVTEALKELALPSHTFLDKLAFWKKRPGPITRLHALWTLDGLHAVNESILAAALRDEDAEVRKAAIRISENFLRAKSHPVYTALQALKTDPDPGVRIQLALSMRYSREPATAALLRELRRDNPGNLFMEKAVTRSLQAEDESLAALRAATMGMDGEDRDLVYEGSVNFKQLCATCHGIDGRGIATRLAPPLAGSPRVNGDKDILLNIVLHGLKGPVDHQQYPDIMQPQQEHNDHYIASVVSYIRNSFGNRAHPVDPDEVRDLRKKTADRNSPWTLEELDAWKKAGSKK